MEQTGWRGVPVSESRADNEQICTAKGNHVISTETVDVHASAHGPSTGRQPTQAMSVISGTEATYLLEARLDRAYTEELKPFVESIRLWHRAGAQEHRGIFTEELKRASRKVGGYWSRIILLYQNTQLRPDFFAPGSPWLKRSKEFRAIAEPLDAQLRLQEPAVPSWSPMNKQSPPVRPHTFRTLEELERQAQRFAGEETLKRFIAKRKEALRLCDEEARQKYAASAREIRQHAQSESEPLGAARALSLREKFFAQAASLSKAPRGTTPALEIQSAEAPSADQPASTDPVQAPTTPAQPALSLLGLQAAESPPQSPAEEPADTAALPVEAPAQAAEVTSPLQTPRLPAQPPVSNVQSQPAQASVTRDTVLKPRDAAQPPANIADTSPAQASVNRETVPKTSAELADTTAAPSALIRELAARDVRGAESDEAGKALSVLVAQLSASAADISAPAQHTPAQTSPPEPAANAEAEGALPVTPRASVTARRVRIAGQPDVITEVTVARAKEVPAEVVAVQQLPVQSVLIVPLERPARTAPTVCEQAPGADKGKGASPALPEETREVPTEKAGRESAALQQMQSVKLKIGGSAQHLKPENPFFELKSFDPELLQAAEQQRSMSLNSNASTETPQKLQPLPDNPFFEIRGPASSPNELLKHATSYLLGGESPSATAADLGILPMSRADTGPVSEQVSVTAPAVAAPELGPKTPRQPGSPPDTLAPAATVMLPAKSVLLPAPQASVAEQATAKESSGADGDVSFLEPQSSAPKAGASTTSEGEASSRQSSHDTSSGKSSDIYLPAWKGAQPPPAEAQDAVKADTPAPASSEPKEKVGEIEAGSSALNSGRLPSWLPSTPGQSMEAFPKAALIRQGSMSGPTSSGSSNSWSASLADKATQLAGQLRRGNTINRITAARRLQRLAISRSQAGDAVWEAEGVLPLTAMLNGKGPQEFVAAASAIAELANPENKAFQIGVGESGGLKSLLAAIDEDNEAQSALASKALASVVGGAPALQEMLLDAGGAEVLLRNLDAPQTPQADAAKRSDAPQDNVSGSKRQQSFKLAGPSASTACKGEEVAGAIAAFASSFPPGQRAVVGAGGLPKLTQLLASDSPTMQEKALSALLACTAKNAEYQSLMTEAGALPHLAQLARGAPAELSDAEPTQATREGKGTAEPADVAPCKATVMAQRALKLLYSLASYFASHAALQAGGCLDVMVAAMASSDATCAQYAVWAIQSLTAGNGRTEEGLCDAGAIQGLLGLIRRCQERPEEAPQPPRKSSWKPQAAPPPLRDLLEPAIVALSNLAAETASVKDDMRQAGAIDTCVQLLTAQGSTVPGHAARALWNLTSKNAANQDAAKEAGAVPLLVAMLATAPQESKGKKVSKCEEAAGTVGSMAACNAPNQDAFRAAGALPLLLGLVLTAERSIKEQAAWALHAMTSKNDACIEDLVALEAPARLLPLLSHPELWNWTPVVSTMQSMSGGTQQAQHALVRADAMTVFLDILSFGRPTLQALSATILGNLASSGDEDAKKSFVEAGGLEKLQELSKSGSLASTPVRKAAARARSDITKGKPRQVARKKSKLRSFASDMLSSKRWCLGLKDQPTSESS